MGEQNQVTQGLLYYKKFKTSCNLLNTTIKVKNKRAVEEYFHISVKCKNSKLNHSKLGEGTV
jgi:hypothetical protein